MTNEPELKQDLRKMVDAACYELLQSQQPALLQEVTALVGRNLKIQEIADTIEGAGGTPFLANVCGCAAIHLYGQRGIEVDSDEMLIASLADLGLST